MSLFVARSREDAAANLGCDVRTFGRWLKEGCPGQPRHYVLRDCIKWAREHKWSDDATLIAGATGDDDDIKTQYLKARIEKLNRENQLHDFKIGERSEQLADTELVRAMLLEGAAVLRSNLEKLERDYGADAVDIVCEALDEVEQIDFAGTTN